jgi:hypothetical protein
MSMRTQIGPSAVMRFTGEFGTYDFNTWWNMAYMALRFRLDSTRGCAFSGDDSLFFYPLVERRGWSKLAPLFSLVGKFAVAPLKEFCGWWLLPCGVVRNPVLLALKILARRAQGRLAETLDNYFVEALYAHLKQDELSDYLPSRALACQRWIMDFAHRHSRHVPHLWMASPGRVLAAIDLPHLLSIGVARMLNPRREFLSPIS